MSERKVYKTTIGLVLSTVPGYSETFFRNKIKGLQDSGFEVVLFVDYVQKTDVDFPCRIVASPQFGGSRINKVFTALRVLFKALFLQPKRSFKLYQLDKKDGVIFKNRFKNVILNHFLLGETLDWLHFGFGMLAVMRENVAQAIGAKMAVSFRGYDLYLSPLKHPGCYNLLFKKAVLYHVLSEGMKQTLQDHLIAEAQIYIITPAIDTDFFKGSGYVYSGADSAVNLITIARLHWKKGLEYTLEALALLKQKGVAFTYTVIGAGDQLERLVFAAQQLGISDEVFFVGQLPPMEVRKKLEASTLYLQYSIQEGFCNAVLEAQSMGLLCIVSNAEGLDENVLDGQTGWVIPKRQPQLLVKQLVQVIQLSADDKEVIRTRAIRRVRDEFNLHKQQAAFLAFYNT